MAGLVKACMLVGFSVPGGGAQTAPAGSRALRLAGLVKACVTVCQEVGLKPVCTAPAGLRAYGQKSWPSRASQGDAARQVDLEIEISIWACKVQSSR